MDGILSMLVWITCLLFQWRVHFLATQFYSELSLWGLINKKRYPIVEFWWICLQAFFWLFNTEILYPANYEIIVTNTFKCNLHNAGTSPFMDSFDHDQNYTDLFFFLQIKHAFHWVFMKDVCFSLKNLSSRIFLT